VIRKERRVLQRRKKTMTQRDTNTGLDRRTRNNETERQDSRVEQRDKKTMRQRDRKAGLDRDTRQ
jgi:hypothetical protein